MESEDTRVFNGLALTLSGLGLIGLILGEMMQSLGLAWSPNRFFEMKHQREGKPEYIARSACEQGLYYTLTFGAIKGGIVAAMVMNHEFEHHMAFLWTFLNMTLITGGPVVIAFACSDRSVKGHYVLSYQEQQWLRCRALPGIFMHLVGMMSLGIELAVAHNWQWTCILSSLLAAIGFYYFVLYRLRVDTDGTEMFVHAVLIISWTVLIVAITTLPYKA
ncbi:MAG: hypothetical protein JKY23_04385 [Nitrospinaceae bacterium]|nr:hypothetical protein [Nitrospinaceae bacterium]